MLVFAHRGASGHEPENTLLAIEQALAMNVDAIEIDVHVCETELVVIHDRWLHKTTNGSGLVGSLAFNELRKLDAGKGQAIPTLEEVLQLINGRCLINIEMKAEGCVDLLLALIEKAQQLYHFQTNQFLFSSFNHHLLFELKAKAPHFNIGALTACCPIDYAAFAEHLNAFSIHIDVDFVNQAFVEDAHQRGLKVYVYTVDDEIDMIQLHLMGVDGIFTNYPTKSMVKIAHLKNPHYGVGSPIIE